MTCSESKQLMLMRNDEMGKQESTDLRRHVEGCRDCAALMNECESTFRRIEALRSIEPVLENAEGLTTDILNSVERARRKRGRAIDGSSARIFGFPAPRTARIAYGVFVLASVGMFLIQQLTAAASVQSLEKKMVQRGEEGMGVRVMYTVPSSIVNRLPQSGQMRSYFGEGETEEENGNLAIDGRSLSRIADLAGSVMSRSSRVVIGEESRKSLESIFKALRQSVSARVTIRSKERS